MANSVDDLIKAFANSLNGDWSQTLSGQERIWFLVYPPDMQRKIDFRLGDFENITSKAGKKWQQFSLKNGFPDWMASHEYNEEYFQDPEALLDQLEGEFKTFIVDQLNKSISDAAPDQDTLIVITDVSAIFGFGRLSDILNQIARHIPGRLLVFFPGEFEKNQFRLLDARDGWSYLARPITA